MAKQPYADTYVVVSEHGVALAVYRSERDAFEHAFINKVADGVQYWDGQKGDLIETKRRGDFNVQEHMRKLAEQVAAES